MQIWATEYLTTLSHTAALQISFHELFLHALRQHRRLIFVDPAHQVPPTDANAHGTASQLHKRPQSRDPGPTTTAPEP